MDPDLVVTLAVALAGIATCAYLPTYRRRLRAVAERNHRARAAVSEQRLAETVAAMRAGEGVHDPDQAAIVVARVEGLDDVRAANRRITTVGTSALGVMFVVGLITDEREFVIGPLVWLAFTGLLTLAGHRQRAALERSRQLTLASTMREPGGGCARR